MVIAVLGRQPSIGIAELESLFGADALRPIGNGCAMLSIEPKDFSIKQLGGTMKAAKFIEEISTTNWNEIEKHLSHLLTKHILQMAPGKVRIGFSAYGFSTSPQQLQSMGIRIKKFIKKNPQTENRSIRIIPNVALQLNSAQIIHNNLIDTNGLEVIIAQSGKNTVVGITFAVQDINAYAARDQARPKRDARVGMLPPKLAQIIINLAVGKKNAHQMTVLDPFCGTGVILQEVLLMGYHSYGSDIDPKMIEYSTQNLSWLQKSRKIEEKKWKLVSGDALVYKWDKFDVIASEAFLGRPFATMPGQQVLRQVIQDVDTILKKFLKNVTNQTKPGFRMCIAVPAWQTKNGFWHLKTLDSLEELGYTRKSFVHASSENLLYHRPDQVVARELLVLIRK